MSLPAYVQPYWEAIQEVAHLNNFDPYLIAAIGDRETNWGTNPLCKPKGPSCLGDMGHGHGLMQIDDRSFPDFCADPCTWANPRKNINKGCAVLRFALSLLKEKGLPDDLLLQAAVAAYNCGAGNAHRAYKKGLQIDFYTAGGNYSADVFKRMERFKECDG